VSAVTFAISPPDVQLGENLGLRHIVSKDLPAGDWAVVAYANATAFAPGSGDGIRDLYCELRSGSAVIGSAHDRRVLPQLEQMKRSLSLNGGAHLPAGGVVSLWCGTQADLELVNHAQLMIMKVGGFF
jgi:hypothetical protein